MKGSASQREPPLLLRAGRNDPKCLGPVEILTRVCELSHIPYFARNIRALCPAGDQFKNNGDEGKPNKIQETGPLYQENNPSCGVCCFIHSRCLEKEKVSV